MSYGAELVGRITARVYAVVLFFCSLPLVVVGVIFGGRQIIHFVQSGVLDQFGHIPPSTSLFFLVPGLIGVVLSIFIWRGWMWAMIAALTLSLILCWFFVSGQMGWRWNVPFLAVAAVFGILTVTFLVAAAKPKTTRRT